MELYIVLFSLYAVALGATVLSPLENRITGGTDVTIEKFPYQVAITYFGKLTCGGIILDEYTILTAANCIHEKQLTRLVLHAGATKYMDGQQFTPAKFIEHEKFDPNPYMYRDNDIGIIKLARPMSYSDKIRPIQLQASAVESPTGTAAHVTGWGVINGAFLFLQNLMMTDVSVISNEECKEFYGQSAIKPHHLCTWTPSSSGCRGDTGGPLTLDGKLIGVISWNFNCAVGRYPSVYVNVSNLHDWILTHK